MKLQLHKCIIKLHKAYTVLLKIVLKNFLLIPGSDKCFTEWFK